MKLERVCNQERNIPKVSIITPMYNGSLYVADTIESVLSQDFVDWEMIIVDDCSPDDGRGVSIVESYCQKDSRIHLIVATVNRGSSGARNQAIDIARGRYLAFLDSDDKWHSDYLSVMMKHIEENTDSSIAIFFAGYRRMDDSCKREILKPYFFNGKRTYRNLLHNCPIFPSAAIVDTSRLKDTVRFNENLKALRDDYFYYLSIVRTGLNAYGYKDILVDYRMRSDSMTSSKIKMIKPQYNIYRKVLKMNIFMSLYYLTCWAVNGIRKYKIKR